MSNNTKTYKDLFAAMLGQKLNAIEQIAGGRNSLIFRLHCVDGSYYIVKKYYCHEADLRDRLGTEFNALTFLWQNGIRGVPRPKIINRERNFAVYEYVSGRKVEPAEIDLEDIDSATNFLISLNRIKTHPTAAKLPNASEACFSINALVENIDQRFARLEALPYEGSLVAELKTFLNKELRPFFTKTQQWSMAVLEKAGLDINFVLPVDQRTLSPSDFGFHNALRLPDNSLVFLDFEYFGWDDPAKMINDFILHPAMSLKFKIKKRFADRLLRHFDKSESFDTRVYALYPFYGIKWCLILLNEFIPSDMARRNFAGKSQQDDVERLMRQLSKSHKMLSEVRENYEQNPFFK